MRSEVTRDISRNTEASKERIENQTVFTTTFVSWIETCPAVVSSSKITAPIPCNSSAPISCKERTVFGSSPDTPQSVSTGCVSRFFQNFSSTRSKDTSYQQFACIRQQDPPIQFVTPPHIRQDSNISCDSIDLSPCDSNAVQQILITKGQNYVEISKPFEMSDVYKYSCRLCSQNSFNSPGMVSSNCQTENNSRDTMGRSNKSRSRDRFVKVPTDGYRRSRSVQNRSENPISPMSPMLPEPFSEVHGSNAVHTPRFVFC